MSQSDIYVHFDSNDETLITIVLQLRCDCQKQLVGNIIFKNHRKGVFNS